jgi:hypothetical protein
VELLGKAPSEAEVWAYLVGRDSARGERMAERAEGHPAAIDAGSHHHAAQQRPDAIGAVRCDSPRTGEHVRVDTRKRLENGLISSVLPTQRIPRLHVQEGQHAVPRTRPPSAAPGLPDPRAGEQDQHYETSQRVPRHD